VDEGRPPWVVPGRAAASAGPTRRELALEGAAGLGVESVQIQPLLVLEVAVPLVRLDALDPTVRQGGDGAHGHQVLVTWPDHEPLQGLSR
jgi:hypothetical protein